MRYAVQVVWNNGDTEYLNRGIGDSIALFPSKQKATKYAEFMKMGMDEDVQSINVVRFPARRAAHVEEK